MRRAGHRSEAQPCDANSDTLTRARTDCRMVQARACARGGVGGGASTGFDAVEAEHCLLQHFLGVEI